MKKIVMVMMLVAFMAAPSYGQNKYSKVLLEQIAALRVYAQYAQKGYSIAKKGSMQSGNLRMGNLACIPTILILWVM